MKIKRYGLSILILLVSLSGFVYAQDVDIEALDLAGKIAYVGDDYNIHTVDLTTAETSQLTENGTRRAQFEFPTWSVDGQLAYFCCSVRRLDSLQLSIFISPDGISSGEEYYSQTGARHVYAYWSPQTCESDECVDLAVLIQDVTKRQLVVELFNSQNQEDGQRNLGEGTPFYYSWSPTGDSLLIHRNNRVLQYYSVGSTNVDNAFDGKLGSFLSPGWSPVDDRILFAISDNDETQLIVLEGDEQITLADKLQGVLSFSWSPDGRYVAYRIASTDMISPIYILDSTTGETIARSNVSGVLSFFWSPDSTKIAYVTLSNPPGSFDINNETVGNVTYLVQQIDGLAWNILDVDSGANTLLNSFIPTGSTQYLMTNFDQFAQSHTIWSPDSTHIVYSEIGGLDGRDSLITILNINDTDASPVTIAEGSFAIWSYK